MKNSFCKLTKPFQGSDGWRNRLASRFRKSNSDQYDLEEAEAAEGLELRDYLRFELLSQRFCSSSFLPQRDLGSEDGTDEEAADEH